MPILVIVGACFSGRKELAESVAGKLGVPCVDDTVLVERAAARGAPQKRLRKSLEPPGALPFGSRRRQRADLQLIRRALEQEGEGKLVVYYGDAGYLLPSLPGRVWRVTVVAPQEERIETVRRRLNLNRHECEALIRALDRRQHSWVRHVVGELSASDLTVSLGPTSIEEAADAAVGLVRQGSGGALTAAQQSESAGSELTALPVRQRAGAFWRAWAVMGAFLLAVLGYSMIAQRAVSRLAAALFPLQGSRAATYVGLVTDTSCGGRHRDQSRPERDCVLSCVRSGARYALFDGKHLLTLSDATTLESYAASRVKVTGILDDRTQVLEIRSIQPIGAL